MASKLTEVAIDCVDPTGLARFWCAVLDYEVQGDEPWVVLADPEGNEFCVLADRCP